MAGKYDFNLIEPSVLNHWKTKHIYQLAKSKASRGKPFYFLDGPPYTSGKIHIGHAWNKALKDMILRYKRMRGIDAWDRAGYDMHGLPTEHATQKELNLAEKEDIIDYGMEKFVEKCREIALRNMLAMNKDFERLGVWMDFENAYQPITPEFMEGEWWLIKKAHENNRLYEGEKTMCWCRHCGTALAKHELEYQNVEDTSIFLKLPVVGKDKEYLVIWTTTPWTIPFNLGVMVNPELEYVRAKVDDETWIVSKGLANIFMGSVAGKSYEIIEEFMGEDLEGTKYRHPLYEHIPDFANLEQESDKIHTVVLSSEFVDLSAGTGLVHMAPGCGPEDYEVGHRNGIPPFNNLDEAGVFPDRMGPMAGWVAKKDDSKFIDLLESTGLLIAKTPVEHDYAHCWRCHLPVIFRTTKQWFFRVEDIKENMRQLNKTIKWIPDYAGSRNFDSWLNNLRDNSITRQRFWGTPLPIWKCADCGKYIVIGSREELKKYAGCLPKDLHKPYIDDVTFECDCGSEMRRVPDVLDVWIDSGTASWSCLGYPQATELFEKLYPADFILEGIDQIRGWFNLLFVASMVSMNRPSYKAVYMHGFVQDSQGRKMSKSLGNYILPSEVIDKYGADTLRYYMIDGANPGIDINYNFDDCKTKHKNLIVLWNLHNFVLDMGQNLGVRPTGIADPGVEERYILSKMHSAIKQATSLFEEYRLNEVPAVVEGLYLELSRTYVQLVRDKASIGTDEEKACVFNTIYTVLMETIKLFTPIAPFICEQMYLDFREAFGLEEESISLHSWPEYDDSLIDHGLETDMAIGAEIVQSVLSCREKAQLGVRWPVASVTIVSADAGTRSAAESLSALIQKQVNCQEVIVKEKNDIARPRIRINFKQLGPKLGSKAPSAVAKLAQEKPDRILEKIRKDGKYTLKIAGDAFDIVQDDLILENEVPAQFVEGTFRQGYAYLDRTRTPELEAEGFAREVTRRIQALRKDSGLQKSDSIELYIEASPQGSMMLQEWSDQIKDKVGAGSIDISDEGPEKKYGTEKHETIRDERFIIFIDRI